MNASLEIPTEFRDAVQGVVEAEAAAQAEPDRTGARRPSRFWRQAGELGWTELLAGGDPAVEDGLLFCAVIAEAIGSAAIETPFLSCAVDAALLMSRCASDEQRRRYLAPALSGQGTLPVALLEPGGEDSLRLPATVCRPVDGGYRLTGTKILVPYLEDATSLLCTAAVPSGAVACLLVPLDSAGLRAEPVRTSLGEVMHAVTLDGVAVGEDARLAEGDVGPALDEVLAVGAALSCAQLYGIGRRAFELTLRFATDRHQFGRAIGSFQAVQHHVVDMYRALEQTRVLTLQALAAVTERGRAAVREVSLAKVKAGEGIPAVLRMAHQIHGGVGYYTDYPLTRLYNAATAAQSSYGSALWHRRRLADLLAGDPSDLLPPEAHPRR